MSKIYHKTNNMVNKKVCCVAVEYVIGYLFDTNLTQLTGFSFIVGLDTHKYNLLSSLMQQLMRFWTDTSLWKSRNAYPVTKRRRLASVARSATQKKDTFVALDSFRYRPGVLHIGAFILCDWRLWIIHYPVESPATTLHDGRCKVVKIEKGWKNLRFSSKDCTPSQRRAEGSATIVLCRGRQERGTYIGLYFSKYWSRYSLPALLDQVVIILHY